MAGEIWFRLPDGRTVDIFANPRHPYIKILLSAVRSPDPDGPMNFRVGEDLARLDAAATGEDF